MAEERILQYVPFNSFVNPSFWHKFTEVKLDIDKLKDDQKPVWGYYSMIEDQATRTCNFDVDSTSFNSNFQPSLDILPACGFLINKNTIEEFKEDDKTALIQSFGEQLWTHIQNYTAVENPSLLAAFFILSFADLKKYKYYYWFGFPTNSRINVIYKGFGAISDYIETEKVSQIYDLFGPLELNQKHFFIIQNHQDRVDILPLKQLLSRNIESNLNNLSIDNLFFAFADPSNNNDFPSILLRNYVLLLLFYCPILRAKTINILSFRLTREYKSGISCKNSLVFKIQLPDIDVNTLERTWVGWEKNERGKFGPKLSNIGGSMDPVRLAESSIDLNLKLIKWRLLPDLDLEIIKETKCLILGSGTLGCSVARTLLGWGVRTITFVDNGCVSYSNPVRQSLFTLEDCLKGGKQKALAAAEALKKIFPGVESKGIVLNIPMPGHSVGESLLKEAQDSVKTLCELIESHDVIFLLMDSRESRWLPTVLGCHYNKIVLNAALGFDTYLVMRHGYHSPNIGAAVSPSKFQILGSELGCYFCNDITAPGNSMKDRTLDQQCTVTRPGISAIAGSLAVELMISILSHKDRGNASAYIKPEKFGSGDAAECSSEDIPDECLLGIVPHTIRGFLSTFSNVLPATPKYNQCIACSDNILKEFATNGFEFLLKVFNSAKILEDITGLTELQKLTDCDALWAQGIDIDENFIDSDELTE